MKIINIKMTSRCNIKCKYCFNDVVNGDICVDDLLSFLVKAKQKFGNIHVNLTGGEPLLHDQLISLIIFLSENSISCCIFTNGVLLNDNYLKIFEDNKIDLCISLDSNILEINNKLRDQTEVILDNLDKIKKYKINTSLTCIVSKNNLNYISDLLDYCVKNRFDVNLIPISSMDSTYNLENLTNQEINMLFTILKKWRDIDYKYYLSSKIFELYIKKKEIRITRCLVQKYNLIIEVDGNIYGCYFKQGGVLANIQDSTGLFNRNENEYMLYNCFTIKCYGEFF